MVLLQLLGNKSEAMSSYTDLIKRNLTDDESSNAVAINNLIALKGPKDASDGLKKLDRIIQKNNGDQSFGLVPGLELKLSPKQKESIFINRMLLLLHSNKIDQVIINCFHLYFLEFFSKVLTFTNSTGSRAC